MTASRFAAIGIAVGLVLGTAGCTNSDPLTHGNEMLRVNVVITNSPTRFDDAFFILRQIVVVPTDPDSLEAIDDPLSLINPRDVVEINANNEGFQFDVPVNLGVGPWRVTSIHLDGFFYRDLDPPASSATCKDYVSQWIPNAAAGIDLTLLGDSTFSIVAGKVNELTINIEHQAFVSAYQDSFICVPLGTRGCGDTFCLCSTPVGAGGCSGGEPFFLGLGLFLQTPQYLSFE